MAMTAISGYACRTLMRRPAISSIRPAHPTLSATAALNWLAIAPRVSSAANAAAAVPVTTAIARTGEVESRLHSVGRFVSENAPRLAAEVAARRSSGELWIPEAPAAEEDA